MYQMYGKVHGATVFSCLKLRNVCYYMGLDEESKVGNTFVMSSVKY